MAMGVRLLGAPSIRHGEEWRAAPLDKRLALLTYLACAENWVSRERLSYLFWPDTSTANALTNLRQLLVRTKALALESAVDTDDKRLHWAVESDVAEFRRAVRVADWPTALQHYRGDLAVGLEADDASEFAVWLEFERSQLRESHRHAALQQAGLALAAGRAEESAALYELLLVHDPLDEAVMQSLLRLLVRLGAVEEARRRLRGFGTRLQAELGFPPSAATELIVTGAGEQTLVAESVTQPSGDGAGGRPRLTAPLTSFVGRERELANSVQRLSSDACRLLTLVGPGGVGKTRLALRTAQHLHARFEHGFVAVPLARVASADALPLALAAALGLELRALRAPLDQIVDFLAPRELLLLLDNFEHLTDGALQVQHLLAECPRLKVLVTSRQRMRLHGEWLLPLVGLETPPVPQALGADDQAVEAALAYDALVLLDERARQVEPGFTITPMSLHAAVSICRLLEGLPLGIELAAGWLRSLSLDEVNAALASSLDNLESDAQDTVDRHRTLKAAIDHSWKLLNPAEQRAGRALAVFHDGCDRGAASAVTGTSLPQLKALVEKSLLRVGAGGRYDSHPLIHRYMRERLGDEPAEAARLDDAHANHFLQVLASWAERLHGPQQATMLELFAPDYGNITTAWLAAVERGWVARCLAAIDPLVLFHGIQGRFTEGERLFGESVAILSTRFAEHDDGAVLLAAAQANHAWFLAGLARFDEAVTAAQAAIELAASAAHDSIEVRALNVLGSIALRRGDGAAARGFIEKGLALAEALDDRWATSLIVGQLGLLELRSGHHHQARDHFSRALAINEALGNTPGIVNDLDYLGQLSSAAGDLAAAAASFERGLALAESSRFRLRIPYLKTQLATVKLALGEDTAAAELAGDALGVAEELGQRALQAEALVVLGRSVTNERQKTESFRRALALADALSEVPRVLEVLVDLAQLPTHSLDARTLLRLVTAHPAARPAQREKALALLDTVGSPGQAPDDPLPSLEDTVRRLLA